MTAVVGLLILTVLILLLTGGTLFQPQALIYVYLPDATGLAQGSPVRVDGIQVGKVESVVLSASNEPTRVVKVTMKVERALLRSITVDSTAQPAADTLVGDKYIQISTGKSPERLPPGGEIVYKGSGDLMTSLDLSQFRRSLEQMDTILTDIENGRTDLGQFIMTDNMYRDLVHRVAELESGVRAAASTTSAVGRELYSDALYRQISEPIKRVDDTLARLQAGQGSAGQFLRDNAQYDQMHAQLGNLRKSIEGVRGGAFMTSTTNHEAWERAVTMLIRQVDEFNASPLMTRSDAVESLTGMARELQVTVKEFRSDPKKFLRMRLF